MATPNEQLKIIHQELIRIFDGNEYVKIIPYDDEPPEKYEIKFFIKGAALNSEGKVVTAEEHSIFINIPFGFPHFPPSCTPQTNTFHPDFDQAAICIGEFWNKDRTLPELIIHIARMIAGELYSTENAFNEAAVSWYQKNADRLPFQQIDFPSGGSSGAESDIYELSDDEIIPHGIDTLNDIDIAGQSDYLGTSFKAETEDQEPAPSTGKASGKSSINRVHLLIRQKRYHELSGFLAALPAEDAFEDRDEIEANITDLIEKATEFHREADDLEHQGDPRSALELFKKVKELVPDYPGIEDSIARAAKSVELAGEWSGEAGDTESGAGQDDSLGKDKKRVVFFDETATKATIKFIPILAIIIVVVLAIAFITPYFGANSKLKEAEKLYSECQSLIQKDNFSRAKQLCEDAQGILQDISLFKKGDSKGLQKKIQQALTSQKMVQGLSGRVFFQGEYVRKSDMNKVIEFTNQKKEADEMFSQSQWKNAAVKYSSALQSASPILDSIEPVVVREVKDKLSIAEINISIERGSSLLARGELEKSREVLSSALLKAEKLPEELGGSLTTEIDSKIKNIDYLQHLDLGKNYFYSNDWESAIKQYEKALRLQVQSQVNLNEGDKATLYANMAEAELYSLINSAKDAFSKSNLDLAIDKYEAAMKLLNEKEKLLQRINPTEIQQQLKRIILRTRLVQYKQKADKQLEEKQYRGAIDSFEMAISAITASGFAKDKEFRAIIEGTRQAITETRKNAAIAERISYLEENYKDIFETNYSAAIPEYLSEPKATFQKYIKGKELYEIQCIETNRGRQLRLVMLYSYDPKLKKWEFYSETE